MEAVIVNFALIFTRIGAFIRAAPVFGNKMIPARIKVLLSFFIALVIYPNVAMIPKDSSVVEMIIYAINQLLLGVLWGFLLQIVFSVAVHLGEVISHQSGVSFASSVDPAMNSSSPMIGQIYMIMFVLVFLQLDWHLVFIKHMADGFQAIPLDYVIDGQSEYMFILKVFKESLIGVIKLSLPIIITVLVCNVGFGIVSKLAPQINLFAFGLSFIFLVSLAIIAVSIKFVPSSLNSLLSDLSEEQKNYNVSINEFRRSRR